LDLALQAKEGINNRSVITERLKQRRYKRIMLVPPSGKSGPTFEESLDGVERALMKRGIELTSPAITGRVVDDEHVANAGAAALALFDLQKALLLAERSNVDAVLQIGGLNIIPSPNPRAATTANPNRPGIDNLPSSDSAGSRYIALVDGLPAEMSPPAYDESPRNARWRFFAPVVKLEARLVDVRDGFILALLQYEADISMILPSTYKATISLPSGVVKNTDWSWIDPAWTNESISEGVGEIFDNIASQLSGND
jgi:hypothetical protein